MSTLSRSNPSARYKELVTMYRQMHDHGDASNNIAPVMMFSGHSMPGNAPKIKQHIERTGAKTLLDYGCGKGLQYQVNNINIPGVGVVHSMREYLGNPILTLFDAGYQPYSNIPTGTFDGVICTDVLEHIPEDDIGWVLDELFGYADKFLYANIACYPAKKTMPNGENAHCTVKPPVWWGERIRAASKKKPSLSFSFWMSFYQPDGQMGSAEFKGP
jgi:hypothetical protein